MRAMELDINTDWVSAYTYVNDPATDPNAPVIGLKLGGDMSRGGDRYLQLGERDFFAFFAAPKAPPATAPTTTTAVPTTTTTRRSRVHHQPASAAGRYHERLLTQVRASYRASRSRLQEFMQ